MKVTHLPKIDPKSGGQNGWLEILPDLPPANVLKGSQRFDYLIVGAGYTGLAAARRLAQLRGDATIALIDAGRVGDNAAGRCSGFAIDQAHNIRSKDFAASIDAERNQLSLNRAGIDFLREVVQTNHIDCDWRDEGKIHGAGTPKGETMLTAYTKNLDLLDCNYEWVEQTDMRDICGTSFFKRGLFTPGTIQIQPAALVAGCARTMPNNVVVYENSPVIEVEYGKPHNLITPNGIIETNTLVLANNGFGAGFGFYANEMIPIFTFGSMTRPLTSEELATLGGHDAWGVIPAHPFGTTVRKLIDNRILIRNIYSYSPDYQWTDSYKQWIQRKHEASFKNRFPMLPDVTFDYTWGGALALSRNGEPIFGELKDNVYGSLCHNGVGIARGSVCGKLIAEHIAGVDSPLLQVMLGAGRPNRNVPKPFLGWGVQMDFLRRRNDAGLEL